MQSYQLGDWIVTANTREEAVEIAESIDKEIAGNFVASEWDMIVLRDSEGEVTCVPIPEGTCQIYYRSKMNVTYAGKASTGTGGKILEAAIRSMDRGLTDGARLASHVRKGKRAAREGDCQRRIKDFEDTLPASAVELYRQVCENIGLTDSYKIEVLDIMASEGAKVTSHNWWPVLTWFNTNIIDKEKALHPNEQRDEYKLRAAFATALVRMCKSDAADTNTLKRAVQDHDPEFWIRHAGQAGGNSDSQGAGGV